MIIEDNKIIQVENNKGITLNINDEVVCKITSYGKIKKFDIYKGKVRACIGVTDYWENINKLKLF